MSGYRLDELFLFPRIGVLLNCTDKTFEDGFWIAFDPERIEVRIPVGLSPESFGVRHPFVPETFLDVGILHDLSFEGIQSILLRLGDLGSRRGFRQGPGRIPSVPGEPDVPSDVGGLGPVSFGLDVFQEGFPNLIGCEPIQGNPPGLKVPFGDFSHLLDVVLIACFAEPQALG